LLKKSNNPQVTEDYFLIFLKNVVTNIIFGVRFLNGIEIASIGLKGNFSYEINIFTPPRSVQPAFYK